MGTRSNPADWPTDFAIGPMSTQDAEAMSHWHYEGAWRVYDLHGRTPAALDAYRSVKARSGDGDLLGFFCTGEEARVPGIASSEGTLDLGWGMNPAWAGRGHGHSFGAAILDEIRQLHGSNRIRAVVQSWNKRSIRVLNKLGFTGSAIHTCIQNDIPVQYDILVRTPT
ncbi:GNAT family N-acetyltransferase [Nocardia sp. BMG51109]|uniref:GNAT family N-acetyltransferase n=1 Tax=Nocardia sp. BMG51109 TaxID=1056816 RepID=UPI00046406E9|nr:GNAT family N-acetyltransferase [Nocardia sp. BMG51109]